MSVEFTRGGATPDEVAVVTAAYLALANQTTISDEVDHTPVWRFSGRWFQH